LNRGKDLSKDAEFQARIADPEQKAFIYGENADGSSIMNKILPSTAYKAAGVFLLGIIVIAIFGSFPQLLPHFPDAKGVSKAFSMTPTIQLMMLTISAIILMMCNVKTSDVASGSVFKSGMTAIVSVYGVAWMAILISVLICQS
jgi:anaerobic C4-dicarboxylate transporter DcuB